MNEQHTSTTVTAPTSIPGTPVDPTALAVTVCAASNHHSAGTGNHDAHRHGPCGDHRRIVTETLTHLVDQHLLRDPATAHTTTQYRVTYLNPDIEDVFDTEDEARTFGSKWTEATYWARTQTAYDTEHSSWALLDRP